MNLHLLQLGDSALPIGGYSQSWGLEAAVERGLVHAAATLEAWVLHWLRHAVGPLEGVVVAVSCRAAADNDWSTVAEANRLLWATLTPPTLRHASAEMGEQLAGLAGVWPWASEAVQHLRRATAADNKPERHHAAVFGALAGTARASPPEAVTVYLHQAAVGCISAGVRGVPVGHTHGQQVLARVHDELPGLAASVVDQDLETAGSFCPAYEVLCHAQSRLYTRLFRS